MYPITKAHLQHIVDRINRETNSPMEAYAPDGDRYRAQPGNYHLDWAYGQPALVRMANDSGGVRTIIDRCSKRELAQRMHAFLNGIDAGRAQA